MQAAIIVFKRIEKRHQEETLYTCTKQLYHFYIHCIEDHFNENELNGHREFLDAQSFSPYRNISTVIHLSREGRCGKSQKDKVKANQYLFKAIIKCTIVLDYSAMQQKPLYTHITRDPKTYFYYFFIPTCLKSIVSTR